MALGTLLARTFRSNETIHGLHGNRPQRKAQPVEQSRVLDRMISSPPVCVVTGATSGIGRAAAVELASRFPHLFLLGRNERRGSQLRDWLTRRHPGASIEFVPGDLSSLRDVRRLAESLRQRTSRVDLLINNAGARFDRFRESSDGLELTFATNHLGHFLLTLLLWEPLVAAPAARLINVSSSAHAAATRPDRWLMTAPDYDRRQAYARSKLANLLFTYELARRCSGSPITVNAMHPGIVVSGFARNNGLLSWCKHLLAHGLKGDLISPMRGARTLSYLATSPEISGSSGDYYFQCRPVPSSTLSRDVGLGRQLWGESVRLTGMDLT